MPTPPKVAPVASQGKSAYFAVAAAVVFITAAGFWFFRSGKQPVSTTQPEAGSGYRLKQTLSGHNEVVRSVAFSPDGRLLASGSWDNTIKFWDPASGTLKQTLSGHSRGVDSLAFSPDGRLLASGSTDTTVKLWDVATGAVRKTLRGKAYESVTSVAFNPDGRLLASGSDFETVRLWDVASGVEKQVWSGDFRPLSLWDVVSGAEKRAWIGHDNTVNCVAFSPDGRLLASGSDDKTIKLWDPASGKLKQTLRGTFWQVVTDALRQTLDRDTDHVESVAFSPDGRTLASGRGDGTIKLWERAP